MNFNKPKVRGRSIVCGGVLALCIAALILAMANRDNSLPEEIVRERTARLTSLSRLEKEHIARQRKRFERLDQESQARLRRLQSDLEKCPSGERLKDVMTRYGKWLAGLPSAQLAELLSLPPDQRLETVEQLLKQQHEERFAELLQVKLEDKDLESILQWWDRFVAASDSWVKSNIDTVVQSLTDEQRSRFHRSSDATRCRRSLIVGRFLSPSRYQSLPKEFPHPEEKHFQELRVELSDRGKKLLDKAPLADERQALVARWVRAAWSSRYYPDVPKKILEEFYREGISDKQREYLERLSGERFNQTLKHFYYMNKRKQQTQGPSREPSTKGKSNTTGKAATKAGATGGGKASPQR